MILELPREILANGPACTNTGVLSTVCIKFGMIASFISTAMAPLTPKSSAVMESPDLEYATTMFPNFSRISRRLVDIANTVITSLATLMSKPLMRLCCVLGVSPLTVPRGCIVSLGPSPTRTRRKCLSHTSRTLFHVIELGSMSNRTNFDRCSAVRSSGTILSIVAPVGCWSKKPSFCNRIFIIGEKYPFSRTRRFHNASSD
mmetsp:Transcript_5398/g.7954  ORF Transcript_5398/g.7954 Transcript_5398/m.7954 type:complete len:202 (-) Transcript_5398:810-1415(-)